MKHLHLGVLLLACSCFDAEQLVAACIDAGRCVFEGAAPDASAADAGGPDASTPDAGDVCAAPPAAAGCVDSPAFADGPLLVLRLQDTDAGYALGFLEVLSVADGGQLLGTIPLSTSSVGSAVPLFDATEPFQGALSTSEDGRFVTVPAYLGPPAAVVLDGGLIPISRRAEVQRVVLRLDACGELTRAADVVDLGGAALEPVPQLFRAATTVNGGQYWSAGNAKGLRTFAAGATTSTALVDNPGSIRHVHAGAGRLFAALGPLTFNAARVISWATPPLAAGCQSVLTLPWVQQAEPTALATAKGTLFVAEGARDGGVYGYTLDGGLTSAWFPAGSSPICTHLAVRDEGQEFLVACRTAAGLVSTAAVSNGARLLLAPPAGSVYRGVAFAPLVR